MKRLYDILACLNGHIEQMEATDHAYTKEYTRLVRKRRVIRSAIRKIERIDKGECEHGNDRRRP